MVLFKNILKKGFYICYYILEGVEFSNYFCLEIVQGPSKTTDVPNLFLRAGYNIKEDFLSFL